MLKYHKAPFPSLLLPTSFFAHFCMCTLSRYVYWQSCIYLNSSFWNEKWMKDPSVACHHCVVIRMASRRFNTRNPFIWSTSNMIDFHIHSFFCGLHIFINHLNTFGILILLWSLRSHRVCVNKRGGSENRASLGWADRGHCVDEFDVTAGLCAECAHTHTYTHVQIKTRWARTGKWRKVGGGGEEQTGFLDSKRSAESISYVVFFSELLSRDWKEQRFLQFSKTN